MTQESETVTQEPTGTFECPICGKAVPHYHGPQEIVQHDLVAEVTQADRNAVQGFHRAMAEKLMADITSGKPPAFGDDAGHDGDTIHQAFARHRIAAEAASRERVAELEAECFRFAAGACINPGQHGLVGDEGGNSVCTAHEALLAEEKAHSDALAQSEPKR